MTGNRIDCDAAVVARAAGGDNQALAVLLAAVRGPIYGLAIRLLADPDHAADATQEALVAVARGLPAFRGEAAFATWAFRVAWNALRRTGRRAAEARDGGFEAAGARHDAALAVATALEPVADPVLVEETRLFCTHGMLLCLEREERAAYILAEILEVPSAVVADVLGVREDALRQRVARARAAMNDYMRARCGLLSAAARCRCEKLTAVAVAQGLVSADRLRFANHPTEAERNLRGAMRSYATALDLFRDHPDYALVTELRAITADLGSG